MVKPDKGGQMDSLYSLSHTMKTAQTSLEHAMEVAQILSVLTIVLFIFYLVAWVMAMQLITKAAQQKGYNDINGKLWFIGLFGLIVTPAIIVAALPDKNVPSKSLEQKLAEEELPEI